MKTKTVNELFLKFIEDTKETKEYKLAVKEYKKMCKKYQDEINAGTLQTFHYPVVGLRIDINKKTIFSDCCNDSDIWNYERERFPPDGIPQSIYYTPEELEKYKTKSSSSPKKRRGVNIKNAT